MAREQKTILEVRDLGVDFWVEGEWIPAAKKLKYNIAAGEVLAIVGESGSGKSASSMALLGLTPQNGRVSGSVKLDGEELIGASTKRLREIRGSGIAVIFQEPMTALNPVYTIGFQIMETLRVHFTMTNDKAKQRALELLEMVDLPDPAKAFDSYPHQLSGGQRQRAMIAQAISCDPKLLVADEPTTALDVTIQAEILDLLRDLQTRLNSAILLITHDMGVVADLADRVLVMKDGEMVEQGSALEIYNSPTKAYTQELLASVPNLGKGKAVAAKKASSENIVLSLREVHIEYPKRGRVPAFLAAQGINLEIARGEVVGLVGESGSGKTTVGRAAVGLLPVKSGQLVVAGKDISRIRRSELKELRSKLGIVFQDPGSSLNPRWSIAQSIAEPLVLSRSFTKDQVSKRVDALLDQVQLPINYRNRYPHELSGGQRQRVGIARALALSPELLVADEPTSALDVSVQARVLELLKQLQKELGFACLFVSHDLAVVDFLADRIAVMSQGEIVEQGDKNQILRNPQQEYTKRLIEAVPVPDPTEQQIRRENRLKTLKP
jgi:peptide/nickel transport system ATP-binding protein